MRRCIEIILINLANLLKVKTILSLAVIFTVCKLTFNNVVSVEAFMSIASAVITYYFTKSNENIEDK